MPANPCLVDGKPFDRGPLPDGLFVAANIRTAGVRPLDTDLHAEVLDRASREVLGLRCSTDPRELADSIGGLLRTNGYPDDGLSFVTVRRYLSGSVVVAANGLFPYRERRLRMIFPQAGIADFGIPFSEYRSSMSEAAFEMARVELGRWNSAVKSVVRRTAEGDIVEIDGAPLFIVEGGRVVSPQRRTMSAEFGVAAEAVRRAGFGLVTERIDTERLLAAEELFFADHRGITAVSCCSGHIYMHLVAERVADFY